MMLSRRKSGAEVKRFLLLFAPFLFIFVTSGYGKMGSGDKEKKSTPISPEPPMGIGTGVFQVGMVLPLPSPINSPYEDYAPVWHPHLNALFFTSRRPRSLLHGKAELLEDIYIASFDSVHRNFSQPHLFRSLSTSVHDAIVSVTPKGDLIIYRSDGNGDLYLAPFQAENRSFGKPIPLSMLNSNYTETSAFWFGKQIYFVSNRPNGAGKRDIYVVTQNEDGSWSDPVNLGPTINSEYDEESPILSPDGESLLFASNRPGGYGGFDLYIAYRLPNGSWSQPVNLGPEINTPGNDIYPYRFQHDQFFYSSNGLSSQSDMNLYVVYLIPHLSRLSSYCQMALEVTEASKAYLPAPQVTFPFVQFHGEIIAENTNPIYPIIVEVFDPNTKEVIANTELAEGTRFTFSLRPNQTYLLRIQANHTLGYTSYIQTSSEPYQEWKIKKVSTYPIFITDRTSR